ncbi:MAG: hypothetical protein V4773_18310 [Verrucomicrobiota bacterium]
MSPARSPVRDDELAALLAAARPCTLTCSEPETVTFAEIRLESGQPAFALYDPQNLKRLVMPESLR